METHEKLTITRNNVPLSLVFLSKVDVPDGEVAELRPGFITSHDGLGCYLSKGEGALSIVFPTKSIPDDVLEDIASRHIRAMERLTCMGVEFEVDQLKRKIESSQLSWLSGEYEPIIRTYFEDDAEPTLGAFWSATQTIDEPYCQAQRLHMVEILVKGTPNGHPDWGGQALDA